MLQVMQDTWAEGRVVSDWKDAVVVPIPKKGDLTKCDNSVADPDIMKRGAYNVLS